MGKYYMKSTKEKIEFGDTITMEFTKEEEGKTVQKTLNTTFTPAIVDTLLKNGIIEKVSSQKKSEEDKKLINNKSLFDNKKILYKEKNKYQINSSEEKNNGNYYGISNIKNNKKIMSNANSDKILELAQNLLNENLISKKMNETDMDDNEKMNYYNNNGSKQSTNDFYSIMMNNSKTSGYNDNKIHKKSYYTQEYDFDCMNGNRRIMDLNYYDNLL